MGYAVWLHQYLEQRADGRLARPDLTVALLLRHRDGVPLTDAEREVQEKYLVAVVGGEDLTEVRRSADQAETTWSAPAVPHNPMEEMESRLRRVIARTPSSPGQDETSLQARFHAIQRRGTAGVDEAGLQGRLTGLDVRPHSPVLDDLRIDEAGLGDDDVNMILGLPPPSGGGGDGVDALVWAAADEAALDQKYGGRGGHRRCAAAPCR